MAPIRDESAISMMEVSRAGACLSWAPPKDRPNLAPEGNYRRRPRAGSRCLHHLFSQDEAALTPFPPFDAGCEGQGDEGRHGGRRPGPCPPPCLHVSLSLSHAHAASAPKPTRITHSLKVLLAARSPGTGEGHGRRGCRWRRPPPGTPHRPPLVALG